MCVPGRYNSLGVTDFTPRSSHWNRANQSVSLRRQQYLEHGNRRGGSSPAQPSPAQLDSTRLCKPAESRSAFHATSCCPQLGDKTFAHSADATWYRRNRHRLLLPLFERATKHLCISPSHFSALYSFARSYEISPHSTLVARRNS